MSTPQPRVWLITGTSTGLGSSLAEIALEKGDKVVATARNPAALDSLVAKFPKERLLTVKVDVTVPEDITAAFERAKEVFGRLDVVVNNAGYSDLGEVESMDLARARLNVDTNFWGTVIGTREAIKFFREVNPPGVGGRIIQVSSMLGIFAQPVVTFYCATKFAINGFTEGISQELDPAWNIKLTCFAPGYTASAGYQKASWSEPHPAYTNPELPSNQMRAHFGNFVPPGDTRKVMQRCYELSLLEDPPLYLPIGDDALGRVKQKIELYQETLEKYASWTVGTQVKTQQIENEKQ
ncbi:NAD-P-binding protein [Trametes elegans]|nr:NAD-P-binding protein [Trametes elegans]